MQLQGDCAEQCEEVGDGLGYLNTQHIKGHGQEQNTGDEEDTLTGHSHKGGGGGLAGDLLHHVTHDDEAQEGEGAALQPQGQSTAGDNIRVITENRHQLRREDKA